MRVDGMNRLSRLSTDPERLASQLQKERPYTELYADFVPGKPESERVWEVITILLLE
jgi:hypothetical protein